MFFIPRKRIKAAGRERIGLDEKGFDLQRKNSIELNKI